jgi:hypothetical protein
VGSHPSKPPFDACPGCGISNRLYNGGRIAHDNLACVDLHGADYGVFPDLSDLQAVERWLAAD